MVRDTVWACQPGQVDMGPEASPADVRPSRQTLGLRQARRHTSVEIKAEGWLGKQQRGSWLPAGVLTQVKSLRARRVHDPLLPNS